MPQNDPTDNALAAIASLFDHKDLPTDMSGEHIVDHHDGASMVVTETFATELVVSDSVVADSIVAETVSAETVVSETRTLTIVSEGAIAEHGGAETITAELDIDGYTRLGPGPLDAIRFRWTARRDDGGRYFVDESIGSSRPISSGPMPHDQVIPFINDRERAARDRFDVLRSEMTLGHPARIAQD